ncbi:MAG: rhodanese-like domain-containing protein [Cocleimonas sp.]|nr:rhodanese-like domain-containing protein [Cocleimonas sp.]
MIKYTAIIALSIFLSACGSETNTQAETSTPATTQQGAAAQPLSIPVPQVGSYSNINNAQLEQLMKQGVTLVDIRRQEEWQQTGIVQGANTITFFTRTGRINPEFMPQFTALVKADQPVALICRTGNRTRAASQAIAKQLGYKKVYNVTRGITGWIGEKRPVVTYKK